MLRHTELLHCVLGSMPGASSLIHLPRLGKHPRKKCSTCNPALGVRSWNSVHLEEGVWGLPTESEPNRCPKRSHLPLLLS